MAKDWKKEIHHVCHCTGQTFTYEDWCRFNDEHQDVREIVHQYKTFGFNVFDVCMTPNKPLSYQNKLCRIEIETAQSDNGQWDYGINLCLYQSDACWGASFAGCKGRDYYQTEKQAIFAALLYSQEKAEGRIKEISARHIPEGSDDDGHYSEAKPTVVTAALRDLIRQIGIYKQVFDPRQLELFPNE